MCLRRFENKIYLTQKYLIEKKTEITMSEFIHIFNIIFNSINPNFTKYELYCNGEKEYLLLIDRIIKQYKNIFNYNKNIFDIDRNILKKAITDILKKLKNFTIYELGKLILLLKINKKISFNEAINNINNISSFETINDLLLELIADNKISENILRKEMPKKCKDNYDKCDFVTIQKILKKYNITIYLCGRFYCYLTKK